MIKYYLSDLYCVTIYLQNSYNTDIPDIIFISKEDAEAHADELNSIARKLPYAKGKNPYHVQRLDDRIEEAKREYALEIKYG